MTGPKVCYREASQVGFGELGTFDMQLDKIREEVLANLLRVLLFALFSKRIGDSL